MASYQLDALLGSIVVVTCCVTVTEAALGQSVPSAPKTTRTETTLTAAEARDEHGRSGLVRAALEGDRQTFQRLLELDRRRLAFAAARAAQPFSESGLLLARARAAHRALVDGPDQDGITPMMLAAERGWDDLVEILLRSGGKASARDRNDTDASAYAERAGFAALAKRLREAID